MVRIINISKFQEAEMMAYITLNYKKIKSMNNTS